MPEVGAAMESYLQSSKGVHHILSLVLVQEMLSAGLESGANIVLRISESRADEKPPLLKA